MQLYSFHLKFPYKAGPFDDTVPGYLDQMAYWSTLGSRHDCNNNRRTTFDINASHGNMFNQIFLNQGKNIPGGDQLQRQVC